MPPRMHADAMGENAMLWQRAGVSLSSGRLFEFTTPCNPPAGCYCKVRGNVPVSGRIMDTRSLSERDICTQFITPALRQARWNEMLQIRE
jgi:hypothetical protein